MHAKSKDNFEVHTTLLVYSLSICSRCKQYYSFILFINRNIDSTIVYIHNILL